ncbi:MAG: hypothetical protein U0871_16610 [Gemmataceae bacterium]
MSVSAIVEPVAGRFRATLLGDPRVTADGATRDEAVARLQTDVQARYARGEIVPLELAPRHLPPPLTGEAAEMYREMTEEMLADIYAERDAQKRAEFPG